MKKTILVDPNTKSRLWSS